MSFKLDTGAEVSAISDVAYKILLTSKCSWTWGPDQQSPFSNIKSELLKPTILTLYNPKIPCKVSADVSSFGLRAVLLQFSETLWKPVAYTSRSMTETKQRYA